MSSAFKARKKPVEVEVIQWNGWNTEEVLSFGADIIETHEGKTGRVHLRVVTLEGTMRADINDYIIKGVLGEFYPCKPDAFAQTYEVVSDE